MVFLLKYFKKGSELVSVSIFGNIVNFARQVFCKKAVSFREASILGNTVVLAKKYLL